MFKEKIKQIGKHNDNNKKKMENIAFLIMILIVTIVIINLFMKEDTKSIDKEEKAISNKDKILASADNVGNKEGNDTKDLEKSLEKILSTIKGVGKVKVFINYSESNQVVAMYDETTTTSSTEETDSSGGKRDTTSTETQKEVVYSDEDGNKNPVTEKVVMPTIEGAIITAEGASNTNVKSNIISAVEAATGLGINKIQVFEKE